MTIKPKEKKPKISFYKSVLSNDKSEMSIDINDLYNITKSGINKNLILLYKLFRNKIKNNLFKDKKEKQKFKQQNFPIITPCGEFSNRNSNDLINLSGYTYLDIDKEQIPEEYSIEQYKNYLINKHNKDISFISLSCSGTGLSILVNIKRKYTKEEFPSINEYIKKVIFKGIKFDDAIGKDISRALFISYDEDVYYNSNASVNIPDNVIKLYPNNELHINKNVKNNVILKNDIYSIREVYNNCLFQMPHEFKNNQAIDIKKEKNINIFLNIKCKVGNRRRTLDKIGFDFLTLNKDNGNKYLYSLLYYINNQFKEKLEDNELNNITKFILNNINNHLENYIYKNKYIHFNSNKIANDKIYTKKQRREGKKQINERNKITNIINGKKEIKESIILIINTKRELFNKGIKVTKTLIHKLTNLSRTTINKHYDKKIKDIDKEINDLYDMINDLYYKDIDNKCNQFYKIKNNNILSLYNNINNKKNNNNTDVCVFKENNEEKKEFEKVSLKKIKKLENKKKRLIKKHKKLLKALKFLDESGIYSHPFIKY